MSSSQSSSGSSMWRKTLVYLGLVEEPEEYDDVPEQYRRQQPPRARSPRAPADGGGSPAPAGGGGWWDEETPAAASEGSERGNVRPLRTPEPGSPHVRAMSADQAVRVTVVEVRSFDDCEQIGARYRSGHPVLFDLLGVERATGRRVLDFVSGVTFALRGRLTKAGTRSFLLVPEGVEIPEEERRRLSSLGYGTGT